MENQKFSGVQDTLFIPLAARVTVSQRFPEYFYDTMALKFKDFPQIKSIQAKSSEYTAIASAARYYNMDRLVETFLKKYPNGNVVNLGAGLETMNYRKCAVTTCFYSIDFPDVIKLRTEILGKAENEIQIPCDITDMSWAKQINPKIPVLFIASGVFQYFKPQAVSDLIQKIKATFETAEMVFDATNEAGIRYAQGYVKKSGNPEAKMYFYINDAEKFAAENGIELLNVRGFYDEAKKMLGKKLGLYTRLAMWVADTQKCTQLLHLKLN